MATEQLRIVIDAVFKGKKGIEDAGRSLKDMDKKAREASEGTRYMAEKVKGHMTGLAAGVVAAGLVIQQTYQLIGEGAQLQKAEGAFENLAASIGSSSDSILAKMEETSNGMTSRAEMIAGASQIISLGLAGNEDDVVRLATVVNAMGLDMQQVILTFANNSTMRLDALGLSIQKVEARAAELKDAGFEGDAFDAAVLAELEAKYDLLGGTAGTTAGEMAELEATLKDIADEGKITMAERWQGVFFGINTAIALANLEAGKANGFFSRFAWALANPVENAKLLAQELDLVNEGMDGQFTRRGMSNVFELADSFDAVVESIEPLAPELDMVTFAHERYADAADMYAEKARVSTTITEQQAAYFAYQQEQARLAAEAVLALEQAEAGYFVSALQATDQTFNLNEEIFKAAEQAGASAIELAILGEGLGLYSEDALDAALKTAAIQIEVQRLAEEYAAGRISVYDMRMELRQFIDDLNGVPTEKTISFKFDIPPIPAELQGGGVKNTAQGPIIYGANGLDFTVPPGYSNDSFGPIYVQSGEHVKVTPANEVGKGGGGATINIYAYPGQSPQAIASAVNQQLAVGG